MDTVEEKYFLTRGKAILAGLILLAVIIVFIVIKVGGATSVQKYKDFENELKNAAESYYDINNELKDRCVGYVVISSEKDIASEDYNIVFRPYIKCGRKYITSNYSEY